MNSKKCDVTAAGYSPANGIDTIPSVAINPFGSTATRGSLSRSRCAYGCAGPSPQQLTTVNEGQIKDGDAPSSQLSVAAARGFAGNRLRSSSSTGPGICPGGVI